MAFDIYKIRKAIVSYLETNLGQFEFLTTAVPEDEQLTRDADHEVKPFFIVRPGKIRPRPRGRSIAGPRHDDYYTWIDVVCIGSDEDAVGAALSLVGDYLVGLKVEGATPLVPDGGQDDFITRSYTVRPAMYLYSLRFTFGINTTPSARPTRPVPPPPTP